MDTVSIHTSPLFPHWKKAQKDFGNNLELLRERIGSDAVHDIRVATKKMRALLGLFTRLQEEPEPAYGLQETIDFFDVLGRYRDTEVCLRQCIAYEKVSGKKLPRLISFFRQQLKTTRGWANQEIHRYHPRELARISRLLKEEPGTGEVKGLVINLEGIIRQQLELVQKHLKEPHVIRKRLKEIYYWLPVFPGQDSPAAWHVKELHDILDDLGNWQDLEILDKRMRHFRKDYLPESYEETGAITELQTSIREQKQQLFHSAVKKLRSWMKKSKTLSDPA